MVVLWIEGRRLVYGPYLEHQVGEGLVGASAKVLQKGQRRASQMLGYGEWDRVLNISS